MSHRSQPARRFGTLRRRTTGRLGRGQSLVEFALILPVVMLIILGAVDFGRVFLGWVELHSMVRVGAGYAAENPKAWSTVNPNTAAQNEYERRMTVEAEGINCTLPGVAARSDIPARARMAPTRSATR